MNKKLLFVFKPPTRQEYEHVLKQLFKRGYVFDPNRQCKTIEDVWGNWPNLHVDYAYLAVYENSNALDAFYRVQDKSWAKKVSPVPIVDDLPLPAAI